MKSQLYRAIALLGLATILGQLTVACDSGGSGNAPMEAKLQSQQTASSPMGGQPPTSPVPVLSQKNEIPEESRGETYDRIIENSFLKASNNLLSTFSIDVDKASYSNVRRFINGGNLPPKDAVRIEELINYFPYEYPQPEGDRPFSITTEISQTPWNPNHRLVHIGLQGKKISTENLPPSNLVFLLDVSGSMEDPNKLPLLKSAFQLLVNELRDNDRVSIVVYAGAAGVVLPPTPGNQKDKILGAIDKLQAGGSTAGGEGIQLAYKLAKENLIQSGNNRVILATDGDFNVGVSSDSELVKLIEQKREEGIFLTVLGVGAGNLQDAKMEKIADKGNGNYAYIDNILEAKKVLVKEIGGTLLTIAKDVKIQVAFNPNKVQGYRLIGYENRLLRNEDFKDDKKDAGELGAGHTVTALYEVIPVGVQSEVKLTDTDSSNVPADEDKPTFGSDDLMQVRLRYKMPNQNTSQLITSSLVDRGLKLDNASTNFKFSAAVAEFGMLLRESQYKGTASFDDVLKLANQSQGDDLEGYRAEFIRLVERSKSLKSNVKR